MALRDNLSASVVGDEIIIRCKIPEVFERSKKRDKDGNVIGEGKNDLVAGSQGGWQPDGLKVNGQQVTIGLNAYIPHVDPPTKPAAKRPAKAETVTEAPAAKKSTPAKAAKK